MKRLRLRVEPFMLRRNKKEVAKDLPPKIEQIVWCEPTTEQKLAYRSVMEGGIEKVKEAEWPSTWAQTPPMGWNSWDCYGPTVEEPEVKANADYITLERILMCST